MKNIMVILLGCLAFWQFENASAASCNRHVICPKICVADDSDACTNITNSSQACELRKYTCIGCISATASALKAPVACVACVIDALAMSGEAAIAACKDGCGGTEMVDKIIKNHGCL